MREMPTIWLKCRASKIRPHNGQLIQKRADKLAELENLKKQYREKHPEVIKTQTEINKINDEIDDLKKNSQKRVQDAQSQGNRKTELQKKNIELEKMNWPESQIASIDQQMAMRDDELRQNATQISVIEAKINTIPNVKVALEAMNNQYQTAKTSYDELLKRQNEAKLDVDRTINAQGETIRGRPGQTCRSRLLTLRRSRCSLDWVRLSG